MSRGSIAVVEGPDGFRLRMDVNLRPLFVRSVLAAIGLTLAILWAGMFPWPFLLLPCLLAVINIAVVRTTKIGMLSSAIEKEAQRTAGTSVG